jgi:WD repeat-containing protein 45
VSLSSHKVTPDPDAGEEERCVVGWISTKQAVNESVSESSPQSGYQILALTYSGGWFRLSLPSADGQILASGVSSSARESLGPSGSTKGKVAERDEPEKKIRSCKLEEFRRFGRWDGWG